MGNKEICNCNPYDIGARTNERMSKLVETFQRAMAEMRDKNVQNTPSHQDLVRLITENSHLWEKFQAVLTEHNVITHVATRELLFLFINENDALLNEAHKIALRKKKQQEFDEENKKEMEFKSSAASLSDIFRNLHKTKSNK